MQKQCLTPSIFGRPGSQSSPLLACTRRQANGIFSFRKAAEGSTGLQSSRHFAETYSPTAPRVADVLPRKADVTPSSLDLLRFK